MVMKSVSRATDYGKELVVFAGGVFTECEDERTWHFWSWFYISVCRVLASFCAEVVSLVYTRIYNRLLVSGTTSPVA